MRVWPRKHEHKKKVKAAKAAPKSSAKKERHDRWHIPHPHFPHWSRRSHADRHHHNAHIGTSGARATHAAPPPASYHKAAHEKLPHGWRQAGPGLYFNVVTGAMTAEHPLPLPKHWRLEKSAGTRGGIGGGEIYFVNVRTHQSLPFSRPPPGTSEECYRQLGAGMPEVFAADIAPGAFAAANVFPSAPPPARPLKDTPAAHTITNRNLDRHRVNPHVALNRFKRENQLQTQQRI